MFIKGSKKHTKCLRLRPISDARRRADRHVRFAAVHIKCTETDIIGNKNIMQSTSSLNILQTYWKCSATSDLVVNVIFIFALQVD